MQSICQSVESPAFLFSCGSYSNQQNASKESKTFRGIASFIQKCGQFEADQIQAMRHWLDSDDTAALVGHREFIDLRTYVFQHGQSGYTRTRFYVNGIVLQCRKRV